MKEIFMFASALDRARRSRRQENAGMKYDPRLQDFVKTTRTGHTMQCYTNTAAKDATVWTNTRPILSICE